MPNSSALCSPRSRVECERSTRLIVIGLDLADARFVAQALSREAFHNVAYFRGNFQEAQAALRP